jgi:hypothetical protein
MDDTTNGVPNPMGDGQTPTTPPTEGQEGENPVTAPTEGGAPSETPQA